jgi:GTP-binding protein
MHIQKVELLISHPDPDQLPVPNLPEYAFVGRSNVGKSSLINMLTNRKNLAHTSSTPGKTRTINLFTVEDRWILADLPGYGYAKASQTTREKFRNLITGYLLKRRFLMNTFILVDIRLEPQKNDLEQLSFMAEHELPFSIAFTKIDKLSKSQLTHNLAIYEETLSEKWQVLPPMFYTSAEKTQGREEVLGYIEEINEMFHAEWNQRMNPFQSAQESPQEAE